MPFLSLGYVVGRPSVIRSSGSAVAISLPTVRDFPAPVIASPCHADWGGMVGRGRVRFCDGCRREVFDLSAMTRAEVARVFAAGDSPCVRFYRRADGRLVTADGTTGHRGRTWGRFRRRLTWVASALAVALSGCRTAFMGTVPDDYKAAVEASQAGEIEPGETIPPPGTE